MIQRLLLGLCFFVFILAPPIVIPANSVEAQPTPQVTPSPHAPESTDKAQSAVEYWDKVVDIFAKLFQIIAITGGGVWAYYKFIKGRVYRPRLKLSVHANNLITQGQNLLLVSLTIENVGLSVVKLRKESMLVRVLLPEVSNPGSKIRKIEGKWIGTFRVFQQHAWIESNETIGDQLTLSIPSSEREAFILQFRVVGSINSLFRKRILEWWKCEIVKPQPTSDKIATNAERQVDY